MSAEWEPRKPEYLVTLRRLKRRLKAVASIGLALAAGAYLTLHDDARADTTVPSSKKKSEQPDKKKKKQAHKPDKNEHRKGMPVPDNLLE
jgi:hypothetical protein